MKKRQKIYHQASTIDTFYCLVNSPNWLEALIGLNYPYEEFLRKLKERNYFNDHNDRTTIKWMASEFGFETTKLTKWIKEIYQEIFELNEISPEKFQSEGIPHDLWFKNYDDFASLTVWLNTTPRKYEQFHCNFVKAKVGTDYFWVHDISHDIINGQQTITVSLKGGFCNEYREELVQRAYFDGTLNRWNDREMYDYEIDEILSKHYR